MRILSVIFVEEAMRHADLGNYELAIICLKNAQCCIDVTVEQVVETDDIIIKMRNEYYKRLRFKD